MAITIIEDIMRENNYETLLEDFKKSGLKKGDTVLVHSAMRSVGNIEGGANTVVRALADTVGPEGTVVAPTFSFKHQYQDDPILDNENDKSEMGAISEAIRLHQGSKRSIAFRHSLTAFGKNAEELAKTDLSVSVFDIKGVFGKLMQLGGKVLLLGVEYSNCTSIHFAEYQVEVPDRITIPRNVKYINNNGETENITVIDYQPNGMYETYRHDFNRIGYDIEKLGIVTVSNIGNAISRVFSIDEMIKYVKENYSQSNNLFAEGPNGPAILPQGEEVKLQVKTALGYIENVTWSVVKKEDIYQ